jgi:hypothetical protein
LTDKGEYRSGVEKGDIITNIEAGSPGVIQTSTSLGSRNLVRDGRYIERE